MTGGALALVLLAAVFHALWNTAAKRATGDSYLFVWCYMTGSAVLCLPAGLVQLAREGSPGTWQLLGAPLVCAVLHIVYSLVLQRGYERGELSVVYPVARGVGPLLTMAVAIAALGERPGTPAIAGGLAVVLGIAVVTGRNRRGSASRVRAGLGYGLATGTAIAAYTLWDSHAVTGLGFSPLAYFGLSVTAQALLLTPGALRRSAGLRRTLRENRREIAVVSVLSPAAYVLVLVAMQTTPVSIVAPVRESSIVIGALLAWWVFREPHPARRIAGAVVVLAGIALIALG